MADWKKEDGFELGKQGGDEFGVVGADGVGKSDAGVVDEFGEEIHAAGEHAVDRAER